MKKIKNFEAVTYYYRIMPYITSLPCRIYTDRAIKKPYAPNNFLGENWCATIIV